MASLFLSPTINLSPVSLSPVIIVTGDKFIAGDNDTGDKFIASDTDTSDKFIAGINDTGEH
jgi:hypothetical protein